jgi:serine/threonine protein kinase
VTMCPVWLLGDRYRLDGRIGAGGMGEVWRATDVILDRLVAVKLLRPELAQREDELARFRAEARSAASVPHPSVVQVYDYCEDDSCGRPYLVLELVDGTSLDRSLDRGPLTAASTMDIIAQAAQGLAAAHAAGLVHRDIKPQNLLVTRSGQVKITDFGIARAADSTHVTSADMMLCTPAYLAPERARGAPATPAADLYALGIVAYQCLAGRLPFTGEPLAVMLAHQQPLPPLPQSVDPGVATLVADLTAKVPRARPASAAEVAARARQLQAALISMATSPWPPASDPVDVAEELALGAPEGTKWHRNRGRPAQQPRRQPAALAGLAGLALASIGAIGLTGWMLAHPSRAPAVHQPPRQAVSVHPSARAAHHHGFTATGPDKATTPPVRRSRTPAPTSRPPSPSRSPGPTPSSPSPTPTPSGTTTPTPSPTPSGTPTPSPTSPAPTASGTPTSGPAPARGY